MRKGLLGKAALSALLLTLFAVATPKKSQGKIKLGFDMGMAVARYSIKGLSEKLQKIPNPISQDTTIIDLQNGTSLNMGVKLYTSIGSKNLHLNLGLEQYLNSGRGIYDKIEEFSDEVPDSVVYSAQSKLIHSYSTTMPFISARWFPHEYFGFEVGAGIPLSAFKAVSGYNYNGEEIETGNESWRGSGKELSLSVFFNPVQSWLGDDPWFIFRYSRRCYETNLGENRKKAPIIVNNFGLSFNLTPEN